jgi:hypothetical protein
MSIGQMKDELYKQSLMKEEILELLHGVKRSRGDDDYETTTCKDEK